MSRPRQMNCSPRSATKGLKESSGNKRTATTNRKAKRGLGQVSRESWARVCHRGLFSGTARLLLTDRETKPNFYWFHSWWWFRAQASALQQATAFLGATNRDATTIPPVLIRRNTSTLNDTFTGDRRFTSSFVSADARRRRILREPATANGP